MLSEEKIKELENKIKEGEKAKDLLRRYTQMVECKEHLENIEKLIYNCNSIQLTIGYRNEVKFSTYDSDYAAAKIRDIINNELAFVNKKLEELK